MPRASPAAVRVRHSDDDYLFALYRGLEQDGYTLPSFEHWVATEGREALSARPQRQEQEQDFNNVLQGSRFWGRARQ